MKLKYYLRGLGTGIFVTALIMTIAFSINETKRKAENELAKNIVDETETVTLTESIDEKSKETEYETKEAQTTEFESTDSKTVEHESKLSVDEMTTDETMDETDLDESASTSANSVVLDIYSGMSSNKVAAKLEELGVIEDKNEFNEYIYQKRLEEKIKVGQFEINYGADYDEILRIITRG